MKTVELSALFDISYGNKLDLNKMSICSQDQSHAVSFIGRTRKNNGVVAFVEEIANIKPYNAGAITVALGGSVLSSFVQWRSFYTAQNVAVLKPKSEMTINQKLYYCLAIKENAFRYSTCGREANRTLKSLRVPDISEIPSFVNREISLNGVNSSRCVEETICLPPISDWLPFKYSQLFDIERGTGPRRQDAMPGSTPFVSAIGENNGVSAMVEYVPCHEGNTLSVNRNGKSVAKAFLQTKPFCSTEDVHIFVPKFDMNPYHAMFFSTLIEKEAYRYSYGRKWGLDRMNNSTIYLPATSEGTPDYDLIEKYIKSLPYSSNI